MRLPGLIHALRKDPSRRTFAGILAATLAFSLAAAGAGTLQDDVDQKALHFTKANATVSVGGTMRFRNSDDVIHNIMTVDADDVPEDHGLQKPGEVISAKFERAGTYQVRCSIHPKMKMTITVEN